MKYLTKFRRLQKIQIEGKGSKATGWRKKMFSLVVNFSGSSISLTT
jgi:hypothetical protein